jgi:hypothetical protein
VIVFVFVSTGTDDIILKPDVVAVDVFSDTLCINVVEELLVVALFVIDKVDSAN